MQVAVYGASGHTGAFVVRELLRRDHRPIAIGRDEAKVAAAMAASGSDVEMRIASLDSAESLDRALSGADAVIHCAGPFLDTARPLIEAALRARVHYFDVTAEQESARSTFAVFDAPARDRGIVVVPAAGFFGGLGDLLATHATSDMPNADSIEIAIALDSWWPTAGTRRTGQRNTAPRLTFTDGELRELVPSATVSWPFPEPFGTQVVTRVPLTETILMARHLRAREMHNFMNEAPLRDLGDPATPGPVAADDRGRSKQRFVIDALVRSGNREKRVTAHGRDIYATTAPIVVEALEHACRGSDDRAGAFALGELVDAAAVLRSLECTGDIVVTTTRKTLVS